MLFGTRTGDLLSSGAEPRVIIGRITDKAERKRGPGRFTPGERVFWLVRWVIREVANGTFDQYLTNSTADNFHETLLALDEMGATEAAAILRQVGAIFPGGAVPADRGERQRLFLEAGVDESVIQELSDRFLDGTRALHEAMLRFAKSRPELFHDRY